MKLSSSSSLLVLLLVACFPTPADAAISALFNSVANIFFPNWQVWFKGNDGLLLLVGWLVGRLVA
jgi:hypothetical protein